MSLKTKVAVYFFSGHMPLVIPHVKSSQIYIIVLVSWVELILILQVENTKPGISEGFFMRKSICLCGISTAQKMAKICLKYISAFVHGIGLNSGTVRPSFKVMVKEGEHFQSSEESYSQPTIARQPSPRCKRQLWSSKQQPYILLLRCVACMQIHIYRNIFFKWECGALNNIEDATNSIIQE